MRSLTSYIVLGHGMYFTASVILFLLQQCLLVLPTGDLSTELSRRKDTQAMFHRWTCFDREATV